MGHTQGVTYSL